MPTVPIPERRVQQMATPSARINVRVPNTGSPISEGIDAFRKVIEEEQRKADQLAVLEADRELIEIETTLLHDPDNGALNRRGKDAFDLPEAVLETYDERTREIDSKLTNNRQRMAFRRSATMRRLDVDRTIQRHVAGEIKAYDKTQTDSYLASEIDAGIAAAGDNERVDMAIARTRAVIADHANRNGLPPEWIERQGGDVASKIRTGVVERMLANGQDLAAREYLKEHRKEISGSDLARLEKAVQLGSVRGESQRQADEIITKHQDMKGALDAARKIKDPEVRDATENRIKDHFSTMSAAEENDRKRLYRTAASVLERNGGNLDAIPPGDWARLDPAQLHALETRSRQIREGVEPVTNWNRYYDLMNLASADGTRQKFMQTDLMQYRHELSDAEFKGMVSMQSQLRQGKSVDEALDGYRTRKQVVDDALASIGVDPTPKPNSPHAKRVDLFRRQVDEKVAEFARINGKKPGTLETQEIVDNLLIKGTVPGSGFFGMFQSQKRLYEIETGADLDIPYEEIPANERKKIEDALRRNNRAVTPGAVVELFKLRHGKRQGASDAAE